MKPCVPHFVTWSRLPRMVVVAGLLLASSACSGAQSARADRDKGLADSPVGGDLETEPLTGALLDGVRSLKDEDYAAAQTSLQQHLADNPKSAAAHYHLGLVALAQGKTDEARSQFERTLELNGQFHGAASMLGVMYYQAGEDVAATRMLEKAREIGPQDARVQANLGAVYLRRGLWAEAMTAYEEATKLAPGHGTLLYNYALAAMERFEHELALEKLDEVLLYRPQFAMAHAARVVCLQGTGQIAKAEAAARKAIDELPEPLADNFLVLGRVLVVQKKPKDAEEFFAKAADLAPNSAAVQLAVGEFRDAMGDRAGALGWYAKYLKHKDRRPDDARRLRERVRTLKGKSAD